MTQITNKVVLITGAGRGVGRALAEAFAAQGAIVAANDITPINLNGTIERIANAGGRAKDYVTDICKKMPVQTMLNEILADWGCIDILINSANVNPRGDILDLDAWDWRRALDVNLTGPFLMCQVAGRVMKEQGGGIIINIISACDDGNAAYIASKTGLLGLTREAARELSAYNIRVNAVTSDSVGLQTEQLTPHKNIVDMILYLCDPEAAAFSGKIFRCDQQFPLCS
ncbi:MAG: SDR family oxidoreductase [Chloroflexota bacterium]|nr:SDR family oxidoreductase [Chloroflexota bacterium]